MFNDNLYVPPVIIFMCMPTWWRIVSSLPSLFLFVCVCLCVHVCIYLIVTCEMSYVWSCCPVPISTVVKFWFRAVYTSRPSYCHFIFQSISGIHATKWKAVLLCYSFSFFIWCPLKYPGAASPFRRSFLCITDHSFDLYVIIISFSSFFQYCPISLISPHNLGLVVPHHLGSVLSTSLHGFSCGVMILFQ